MSTLGTRVLAELAALRRDVAGMVARIQALEGRTRPVLDPAADHRLLSAIAGARGRAAFSARDLSASADSELRAVLDGRSVRAIGAWLKRLHKTAPEGPYRLERVTRDGAGVVWMVSVSALRHTQH